MSQTIINEYLIEKHGDIEVALAYLFLNDYITALDIPNEDDSYTAGIFMIANDVFAYASSDLEPITVHSHYSPNGEPEVIQLYNHIKTDSKFGWLKWLCLKRGEQPINPLKNKMIEVGSWSEDMENLRLNYSEEYFKLQAEKKKLNND
jgi:hypothetical protein